MRCGEIQHTHLVTLQVVDTRFLVSRTYQDCLTGTHP